MKDKLIYLATPYSKWEAGITMAFVEASRITAQLLRSGYKVYSPIAHTHPIAVYGNVDPYDHSIWLPFDKIMMDKSDVLLVATMDGWQQSTGVQYEIREGAQAYLLLEPHDHEDHLMDDNGMVFANAPRPRGSDFQPRTEQGIRTFGTGATRDLDANKLDFEGFLSPLVLRRYAEHMHKARKMSDGSMRASDNWQLGIPKDAYIKSAFRHFFDVWSSHRGIDTGTDIETELCALLFNVTGYLHEHLKGKLCQS